MKIVVIIPTYNEKENIGRMIDVLEEDIFPKIKNNQMEILVVDDKSPDGTADVVRQKMKKYANVTLSLGEKQGLGAAYKRGMQYAMEKMKADAVIEFDADFQHDPKYIIDLVQKFDQGYDYVIGSRFVKGGLIPSQWSFYRKFLTKYGGLFSRIVLFFPHIGRVKDVSTGLKLTKVSGFLDKMDFSKIANGFFYKTQMLYQIVNMGAKVVEIPLQFKLREKGKTKMSFSDVGRTFLGVIKLRLTDPGTLRFIKFGTVGFTGYLVNAFGLEVFRGMFFFEKLASGFDIFKGTILSVLLQPSAWSAAAAAELSILVNFTLNNFWTFTDVKITRPLKIILKFLQFNLTSAGAIIIQFIGIGLGVIIFKDTALVRQISLVVIMPVILTYNYTMYNLFIWKRWKLPFKVKVSSTKKN